MTLCDLVTVFLETKSVPKSRLHCTLSSSDQKNRGPKKHYQYILEYQLTVCQPPVPQDFVQVDQVDQAETWQSISASILRGVIGLKKMFFF